MQKKLINIIENKKKQYIEIKMAYIFIMCILFVLSEEHKIKSNKFFLLQPLSQKLSHVAEFYVVTLNNGDFQFPLRNSEYLCFTRSVNRRMPTCRKAQ